MRHSRIRVWGNGVRLMFSVDYIPEAPGCKARHVNKSLWTYGESNPALIHAMDAYYRYTIGPSRDRSPMLRPDLLVLFENLLGDTIYSIRYEECRGDVNRIMQVPEEHNDAEYDRERDEGDSKALIVPE